MQNSITWYSLKCFRNRKTQITSNTQLLLGGNWMSLRFVSKLNRHWWICFPFRLNWTSDVKVVYQLLIPKATFFFPLTKFLLFRCLWAAWKVVHSRLRRFRRNYLFRKFWEKQCLAKLAFSPVKWNLANGPFTGLKCFLEAQMSKGTQNNFSEIVTAWQEKYYQDWMWTSV